MREIKFRAWNKINKVMSPPFTLPELIQLNSIKISGLRDIDLRVVSNGLEFAQYTGLKDKNGKEIYEGDIISNCYLGEERARIIFHCGSFKAEPCWSKYPAKEAVIYKKSHRRDETESLWIYLARYNGSEIIGNTRENPELLGQNLKRIAESQENE